MYFCYTWGRTLTRLTGSANKSVFIYAITGEGVTKGLNWLRNNSPNKKYDGMPIGYTSQPTDEELIDFVVLLTNGKDIYPNRVGRVDLFDRHPAAIIQTPFTVAISYPVCLARASTTSFTAGYLMRQNILWDMVITKFKIN
ncbi:ADP-ribosylation factor 1 [Tanacetum coccineum]